MGLVEKISFDREDESKFHNLIFITTINTARDVSAGEHDALVRGEIV